MRFRRIGLCIFGFALLYSLSSCTYIEDYVPAQATATADAPAALATQAPTVTLLPSATPQPTLTFTPTATLPPTQVPTPTATPRPYALQPGAVISLPAFTHADAGCTWMGVGGQVIGADGKPVENLVITVTGTQDGALKEWMGYTGAAPAYGAGGFEIQLGSQVAGAQFTIQLFDLDGRDLSDPFNFTTSADCTQNLTLINFSINLNLKPVIYLPNISN